MAGLYPSLEDLKVDQICQSQNAALGRTAAAGAAAPGPASAPAEEVGTMRSPPYPLHPQNPGLPASMYPELDSFMGLEFNEEVIRLNMPEYLPDYRSNGHQLVVPPTTQVQATGGLVAPISGQSPAFHVSQLNHGIRQVVLCKDGAGKVGLRVKSIDKGVFVALVTKDSPTALSGLRFGDQILQIDGGNVAGYSEQQVHKIFKNASVNNIVLAVRDRPFERTLTLHKDSTGHIGFQFKEGEIKSIVVDSSAARNGLLISHYLVEVNGQNVVGISDKDIGHIIDTSGSVVTITVIPSFVYKHMIKSMSYSLVKKMMDHSVPEM